MKSTDELKKEIAEAAERESDPLRKEKALREKVNWLRENHPDAFHREPWTSPKWLQKDKLGKIFGRTRFSDVFAELAAQALPLDKESRERTRKLGGYAWEGQFPEKEMRLPDGTVQPAEKKRMDLIVIPDVGEIAEELGMSERNVGRYLLEMVRCGVLKELPKKLDRGRRGFVIGEWTHYWDETAKAFKARRLWLLKSTDKKMRAKLLTLKVGGD